jgi:DNA-binding CsgD family transcriptional regulator
MASSLTDPPLLIVLLQAKHPLPAVPVLPLLQAALQRSGWDPVGVFEPVARQGVLPESVRLTTRQKQILLLVEQGLVNADIARQMALSPGGIDGHLRRIFKKLYVKSRCEAVAKAIRLGLI